MADGPKNPDVPPDVPPGWVAVRPTGDMLLCGVPLREYVVAKNAEDAFVRWNRPAVMNSNSAWGPPGLTHVSVPASCFHGSYYDMPRLLRDYCIAGCLEKDGSKK